MPQQRLGGQKTLSITPWCFMTYVISLHSWRISMFNAWNKRRWTVTLCILQRMIETGPWGDDSATIEKQILGHNKTHSSIQRSQEVDRARDELVSGPSLPCSLSSANVLFLLWTVLAQCLFFTCCVCKEKGYPSIMYINARYCVIVF